MWWIQDKQRLATELQGLEDLQEEGWIRIECWAVDDLDLTAAITLTACEVDYRLALTFPQHYPNVPAWLGPADGETRLSEHQFGAGGSLCLEYGPDNWTPGITCQEILRSALKLLETENPSGDGEKGIVANGHVTAQFQLGFEAYGVHLDADLLARIKAGPVPGLKAIRWAGPEAFPVFLFDPTFPDQATRPPATLFYDPFSEVPVFQTSAPLPDQKLSRDVILSSGAFDTNDVTAIKQVSWGLFIFNVGAQPIAFLVFGDDNCLWRPWAPIPAEIGVRSGLTLARAKAKVVIVGAGSVGSKVAETMVRAGCRHFLLIDGDIFLPGNLERNTLDWRDVGVRKVEAIRARLLRIAPDANIEVETTNLNWQQSSRVHAALVATIARHDLVIDATGEAGTSLMLGAIAAASYKPFLSVEVFEGGIGAMVATCLPGITPSYSIARARFLNWCFEEGGEFKSESALGRYEGRDDAGAPIVADDATVSIAAGHASRAALDIVDGSPPHRSRAWLLIGLRDQWLFAKLGPHIHVDVGEPAPVPGPADPATEAFVDARLKEMLDAYSVAS